MTERRKKMRAKLKKLIFRSGPDSTDKSSFSLSEPEETTQKSTGGEDSGEGGLPPPLDTVWTTDSQPFTSDLTVQSQGHGQVKSRPWSGYLPELSFPNTKIPMSASASGDLTSSQSDQDQSFQSSLTSTTASSVSSYNQSATSSMACRIADDSAQQASGSGASPPMIGSALSHVDKQPLERKSSKGKKQQPAGTFEYTIRDRDTLVSIAAHFEVTPSELMKVNRLHSRTVFAGQSVFIPDPDYVAPDPPSTPAATTSTVTAEPTSPAADTRPKVDIPLTSLGDRSPSSVPGHVVKVTTPPVVQRQLSENKESELDKECHQKFVKIRSRRILEEEKGETFGNLTCKGTLLVTPNAIMFDPDVNDQYVLDNGGQAKFSAVIYMENIKGVAVLPDTSSRFFWRQPEEIRCKSPRPQVYRPDKDSLDFPDAADFGSLQDAPDGVRPPPDGTSMGEDSGSWRISPEGAKEKEERLESNDNNKQARRMSEELENMSEFSQGYGMSVSQPGRTSDEVASTFTSDPLPSANLQKQMSRSSELAVSEISLFEDASKTFGETRDFGPHMGLSSSDIRHDLSNSRNRPYIYSPGDLPNNGRAISECESINEGGLNTPTQGFAPVFFTDRSPSNAIAAPKAVPGQKAGIVLTPNLAGKDKKDSSMFSSVSDQSATGVDEEKTDVTDQLTTEDQGTNNLPGKTTAAADEVDASCTSIAQPPPEIVNNAQTESARISSAEVTEQIQSLNLTDSKSKEDENSKLSSSPSSSSSAAATNNNNLPLDSTDAPTATSCANVVDNSGRAVPSISSHSSSFSPLRNPAQHISSFINYTTGFFRAGDSNKTSPSAGEENNSASGVSSTNASGNGTPKSSSSKLGKGLSAFPFPSSLIPDALSSSFPSFSLISSSPSQTTTPATPSVPGQLENSTSSSKSEQFENSLGPPLSTYLPRSDSPQFEDPPMYLQIRTGIPAGSEELPRRPHAIVRRVKGRMLEEYWFLIPRSMRNKIYKFIIDWQPEVYGDQEQCQKREKFFYNTRDVIHLIQPIGSMPRSPRSPNASEDKINIIDDHFSDEETWEILSHLDADPLNILVDRSPQDDLNLPDFTNGPSAILTPQHVVKLMTALPVNMSVGYNWTLVFSTARHGFSLSQLYREMRVMDQDLPVVLCLTDTDQNVFGAYLSTTIRVSETFYGSGSTFLFTFYPEFKHFHWQGDNFYFMNGSRESFAVGSGEGIFGLWLDGDLDKGSSHYCTTFHNDILTPKEDFHIVHVEAWQLTDLC